MESESWVEEFGVSAEVDSGSGGLSIVTLSSIFFYIFMVFHGSGGVGGKFTISKLIWVIGVVGAIILGSSIRGISFGCVGVGVVSILSLSAMFLMFRLKNIPVSSFSPDGSK